MAMKVKELTFSYQEQKIIEDISLTIKKGEFIGIIGPNGSGKSTILKNLYRALQPQSGTILLDDEDLFKISAKKIARKLGVMGQENVVPFDFKVEEIVAMGRSPYKKLFSGDTKKDKEIVTKALRQVNMEHMAKKSYMQLSGGEKQRVLMARVLAQEPELLVLDEPTNHLDIHHQLQIFDLMRELDVTVIAAIHDLNIAALYCDKLYVLKNGKLHSWGTPEEILTPELISEVYGIHADVSTHPVTNRVTVTYIPASLHF